MEDLTDVASFRAIADGAYELSLKVFDQMPRVEYRTHKTEVAVIEAADITASNKFAKTIQRKGQIAISLDAGRIEGLALVPLDQVVRRDTVGNLAERRIATFWKAIKT